MPEKNPPKVSIIIPNYNYGRFLGDALKGVLNQTFTDYEVIVVDDGSTDDSRSIIDRMMPVFKGRLRTVYQKNKGVYAARNSGLRMANGIFISFLDADDVWMPTALEHLVQSLERSQAGVVYSDTEFFDNQTGRGFGATFKAGSDKKPCMGQCLDELFMRGNFIPFMTTVVRREVFDAVGNFDESFRVAEDYEFWLRVSRRYPIGYVNEVLCRVRRHGENLTLKSVAQFRSQIRIIKRSLCSMPEVRRLVSPAQIKDRLYGLYYDLGRELVLAGKRKRGRLFLAKAWQINQKPFGNKMIFYMALSYFPFMDPIRFFREWLHALRMRNSARPASS
ncbi:MAG: glycosyltransferase [Candidatus Omnitrophica bacterium]|nr:glycosyltransferase [Candidatus Omnitrophota bacterium]